jgi:hypothetical protein
VKARTRRKNVKYKRLEKENQKYQEIIEELQNKIKYDDYLKEENRKMITWIKQILKEFGTMEVRNRDRIQIPIMKRKEVYYGDNNFRAPAETIIIPEIIISKTEY